MRPPSRKLQDFGRGPDRVLIYPMTEEPDSRGAPIRKPSGPPVRYDAIVEPSNAVAVGEEKTQLSETSYSVLLYVWPDPKVLLDDLMTWEAKTLIVLGDAIPDGPGAWTLTAREVGPDTSLAGIPYDVVEAE
jgi:hypothetical protein